MNIKINPAHYHHAVTDTAVVEFCDICDSEFLCELDIHQSRAGYCVGFCCPGCSSPISRESNYAATPDGPFEARL